MKVEKKVSLPEKKIKSIVRGISIWLLGFPLMSYAGGATLDNPLGSYKDIPTLVKLLLGIVLKVGTPLVAVAIIWTGYLFIAARGKPEELKKAKTSFFYTLIGAFVLLGAYAIAEAIFGTIDALRS